MTALSYANDIRPLFTPLDRDHMMKYGPFDLWAYADVKTRAQAIYKAVQSGDMPPEGSEPSAPWPDDRVALFKSWIDAGYPP